MAQCKLTLAVLFEQARHTTGATAARPMALVLNAHEIAAMLVSWYGLRLAYCVFDEFLHRVQEDTTHSTTAVNYVVLFTTMQSSTPVPAMLHENVFELWRAMNLARTK
jgi:hypothetical protein